MKLVHGAVSIGIIAAVLFGLPAVIKPRWNDLLALFGEKEIVQFALSVTVAHLSMLVFANGFFGLCYAGIIPILRNYKIHPDRWPWESGDAEKRAAFWKLLRKAILLTLFNNIVIAIPAAFGNFDMAKKLGLSTQLSDFPHPLTVFWQLLAFMLVEDVLFYTSHRTLHTFPFLYKHVHKVHHQWYYSIGISAEYAHPVEFILGNALPFSAGPLLFGAHLFTWWTWSLCRIWHTVEGHSGFNVPWSPFRFLPLQGTTGDHDAHHSLVKGNYASFFCYLDRVFGTEIPEKKVKEFLEGRAAVDKEAIEREKRGEKAAAAGKAAAGDNGDDDAGCVQ